MIESTPHNPTKHLSLVELGLASYAKQQKTTEDIDPLINVGVILGYYGTDIYKHSSFKLALARDGGEYFVFRLGKTKEQTRKLYHAIIHQKYVKIHVHQKGRWEQQIAELAKKRRGGKDSGQKEKEYRGNNPRGNKEETS
jgi:hypothetical protein